MTYTALILAKTLYDMPSGFGVPVGTVVFVLLVVKLVMGNSQHSASPSSYVPRRDVPQRPVPEPLTESERQRAREQLRTKDRIAWAHEEKSRTIEAAMDSMVCDRLKGVRDAAPEAFLCPAPKYPKDLLKEGIEGHATVRFTIGVNGEVINPVVTEASRFEFGEEALTAIFRSRFLPMVKDGIPVSTQETLPYVFPAPKRNDRAPEQQEPADGRILATSTTGAQIPTERFEEECAKFSSAILSVFAHSGVNGNLHRIEVLPAETTFLFESLSDFEPDQFSAIKEDIEEQFGIRSVKFLYSGEKQAVQIVKDNPTSPFDG